MRPFLFIFITIIYTKADESERKLYNQLLSNYNILERPVENGSLPVIVRLKIILQQIVDVDEKNQLIQTSAWLQYKWHDYQLKWDLEEFGNKTDLRFPHNRLWKPDVLLYNSVDTNFDNTHPANLVVYNTGEVNWIPPVILRSSCKIDIKWFPFDDQACYLKFGSWTYNGGKLDLQMMDNGFDTSEYIENGEWLLMKNPVTRGERFYDCCKEPYPDLKFWLHIRRRTLYYGFNLIIPSVLISLMTLLAFALPAEAGEKITLEITILLSVCVFLSMVAQMIPATSEAVPLIGAFFSCNMLVVSVSVVFSVIVLNLHYRTPNLHTMPSLTRKVLLHWLPCILMMKRPEIRKDSSLTTNMTNSAKVAPETGATEFDEKIFRPNPIRRPQRWDFIAVNEDGYLMRSKKSNGETLAKSLYDAVEDPTLPITEEDRGTQAVLTTMRHIYEELRFVAKRMRRADVVWEAKNEWKFAAAVVDRLCFIAFTTIIVLTTCGVLYAAPHIIA